ncbi:hypothetical protein ACTHGU_07620 [Chitinophagaceae bacterium MMS25-I14]
MLEELMQMIQQHGQESVVNNAAVPNEHNEGVMQEAGSSIMAGLQGLMANGGLDQLASAFQGGQADPNHPAVQQISGNFAQNIMQKFGINNQAAAGIAASLIPMVLGKVLNQGGQQQQQGGGGNILSSLLGGQASGMINSIGSKIGLDKDGDGDVDLSDVVNMIK